MSPQEWWWIAEAKAPNVDGPDVDRLKEKLQQARRRKRGQSRRT